MNYYMRSTRSENNIIVSILSEVEVIKFLWVRTLTGHPHSNYSTNSRSSLWDLKSELKLLKVENLCNQKIWEF